MLSYAQNSNELKADEEDDDLSVDVGSCHSIIVTIVGSGWMAPCLQRIAPPRLYVQT